MQHVQVLVIEELIGCIANVLKHPQGEISGRDLFAQSVDGRWFPPLVTNPFITLFNGGRVRYEVRRWC
jgi:hypothetical protein